jgi:hypothetical protein
MEFRLRFVVVDDGGHTAVHGTLRDVMEWADRLESARFNGATAWDAGDPILVAVQNRSDDRAADEGDEVFQLTPEETRQFLLQLRGVRIEMVRVVDPTRIYPADDAPPPESKPEIVVLVERYLNEGLSRIDADRLAHLMYGNKVGLGEVLIGEGWEWDVRPHLPRWLVCENSDWREMYGVDERALRSTCLWIEEVVPAPAAKAR